MKSHRFHSAVLVLGLMLAANLEASWHQDTSPFQPGQALLKASHTRVIPDAPNPRGDQVTIDVLAFYTDRFAALLHPKINQQDLADSLQRSYSRINRFFEESGLHTRVRLVGIEHWNPPRVAPVQDDLNALIEYAEGASQLRDLYAADLVQLWDKPDPGHDKKNTCGWAQIIGPNRAISSQKFGYSVVMKGAPDSEFQRCYGFASPENIAELAAHEIGHNLGSAHELDDPLQGAFEFSHGRRCDQQGDRSTGSLMTNANRHTFFSDGFGARVTDCPSDANALTKTNNRETFTRTASYIADLRTAKATTGTVQIRSINSIDESAGVLRAELYRTQVISPASVELVIMPDEASAADFDAPLKQVISFDPGQAIAQVDIRIVDDSLGESDEQFTLWLQKQQGTGIGENRSERVYILDNDPRQIEISLQARKIEIDTSEQINLYWQASHAGQCRAYSLPWRGPKPTTGQATFSPNAEGDFSVTLRCYNAHDISAEKTLSFSVSKAPDRSSGSGGSLCNVLLLLMTIRGFARRRQTAAQSI